MPFSINTNLSSLQAQNYLLNSSNFQTQTIDEVSSGLRIVHAGDDATGLAIANGFRSDETVLTQGVQNANDGLATLQTIDGGMNNISLLLDRATTLATESASGTFTGNRATLNAEFQGVIGEINRQAQSIGMNQGGQFAKQLSFFIGGGEGSTNVAVNANGTINLDLSQSAVDAQSLGLEGVLAVGTAGTDIGTGSVATSVQDILANVSNSASDGTAGFTSFTFSGPGFGDSNKVSIAVDLAGVTDPTTLTAAINNAIQNAGNGTSQYATAFKNLNISASTVTDSQGRQQLSFTSGIAAFQVQAGDLTANALLGNFAQNASLVGTDTAAIVAGGGSFSSLAIDGSTIALAGSTITALAAGGSKTSIVNDLNSDPSFSAAATASLKGNQVVIQSNTNAATSSVQATGTLATSLGLPTSIATAASASTGASLKTTVTGEGATADNSAIIGGVLGSTVISNGVGTNAVLTSPNAAPDANILALNNGAGVGTIGTATTITGSGAAPDSGLASGLSGDSLVVLVNGVSKTVPLTAGDTTLAAVMATINGTAALGVTASISNPGVSQQLVLSSNTTGSANTISIDGVNSSAAALTALGFTGSETGVPGTNSINDTLVLNVDGVNQNVTIQAGDTTLAAVVSDINNTTLNPGLGVVASISNPGASQRLVLTSTGTPGATDTVTVVSAGTTAELLTGTPLGFAGGETASGTSAPIQNNTLSLSIGTNSPVTVTLASGSYTAAQMVTQLNTQLAADGVGATATLDAAGHLVLTANQAGASLALNAATGSAYTALGLTAGASGAATFASSDNIQVRISGGGMSSPVTLALNPTVGGTTTVASVLADLTSQVAGNSALAAAGISVTSNSAGNNLVFTNNKGEKFQVAVTGDTNNELGFGSFRADGSGDFDYSTITGGAPLATTTTAGTLNISFNGGATTQITVGSASSPAATLMAINSQITTNPILSTAGLVASLNGSGELVLTSTNNTDFRISGGGADLGFGISGGTYAGSTASAAPTAGRIDSAGAFATTAMAFTPIARGDDNQTVTITADDANSSAHSLSIPLQNSGATQTGSNIDQTIHAINTALQQSDDPTLQSIYAVKEDNSNGTESIKFMSTTQNFTVAVSSLSDLSGITPPSGGVSTATQNGVGGDMNIDTVLGAGAAVTALAAAVQNLGTAQAAVGKGENLLNYGTSLAQSQLTDEASSESQIRDANLAQEAANLTKAQILMQAGTAALSQANSTPQQLLSLLQGQH